MNPDLRDDTISDNNMTKNKILILNIIKIMFLVFKIVFLAYYLG